MNKEVKDYLQDKVASNTRVDPISGCHIWTASCAHDDYGRFNVRNINPNVAEWFLVNYGVRYAMQAHRVSFIAHGGKLTKKKSLVLHSCSNRSCVNPAHLRAGNQLANVADAIAAGKRGNKAKFKRRPDYVIEQIIDALRSGRSMFSVAKAFGIHFSVVSNYKKKLDLGYYDISTNAE